MARIQHKPLDQPDEVRPYTLGRTEIFEMDDFVIGRMIMEPGWTWQKDVRPIAGTERCMYHHLGFVQSGTLHVTKRIRAVGLEIRCGVHTGEVELVPEDVRGVAVHLASRIMALADAGEVLVSGVTHDLLAGSGLRFESRGRHELKGIDGERKVYSLVKA